MVLFNILGQEVATLIDGVMLEEGEHELEFSASSAGGLASGVYFYRLSAESSGGENTEVRRFVDTKKMILIR